jgi:hypothetical protein
MSLRLLLSSLPECFFLLRCAAWLVPIRERADWLAEWRAEVWHAWDSYGRSSQVTDLCLGAFQDAFWLRWYSPRSLPRRMLRTGSASRCSAWLAGWTAISFVIFLFLPGARKAMSPSPYWNTDGLVMISSGGYSGTQVPTIALKDYQSWKTSARHLFSGIAFYQPIHKRVHIAMHRGTDLSIGRASDNLFKLLNLPAPPDSGDRARGQYAARLFLSQAAWRELFGSDAGVIGKHTKISGQRVLIAGVIAQDSSQLPGQVDAWLLEDEGHLDMLSGSSKGFVVAHMRTSGPHRVDGWRTMNVRSEEGDTNRFDCISLAQRSRLPFSIFLFTLIVAAVTLPATTALPLGEYPRVSGRLPWVVSGRRWLFLLSKISLVVPLVCLSAVDVAYGIPSLSSTSTQYIQLALSYFGFLFAFRWILQDQRKRCPVCLRVLSNPARVGEASRNFLAWNGTELICAGGHGLLHIPELPTSWFSTQRWLYLDASWGGLFSEGCVPFAGFG